jgi:hypothetical protein
MSRFRCPSRLAFPLLIVGVCGCNLSGRVDKIGRVTESLGRLPGDTRAIYVAPDHSLAFEVIGRMGGDGDPAREPRVRYVLVDSATVARAMRDGERRAAQTPTTLPAVWVGATPGPPARVIPPSVNARSATPADLPPHFRDARRIEWNGSVVPRQLQLSAVTTQPVELNGREYLLVAGPYPRRQTRTPGGSIAYAALIVPALGVDVVAGAGQYVLVFISAPAWGG